MVDHADIAPEDTREKVLDLGIAALERARVVLLTTDDPHGQPVAAVVLEAMDPFLGLLRRVRERGHEDGIILLGLGNDLLPEAK